MILEDFALIPERFGVETLVVVLVFGLQEIGGSSVDHFRRSSDLGVDRIDIFI